MAANFNVRKIRHTVQRMHGYEYSVEIIIVPLKDRITETNFFMGGTRGGGGGGVINIPLKELLKQLLREKCPYSELLLSVFSIIRTRITPNMDTFNAANKRLKILPSN